MKKITFLLCLLTLSLGYAQTDVIENFDGTAPNLAPDNAECTAIGLAIGTTQAVSGNSLEIIAQAAGNPWQGAQVIPQGITGIDLTAGSTNRTMTAEVYSTVPGGVLAKVTGGTGPDSATGMNHGGTGWETLTFDFTLGQDNTGPADGIYPVLRFYPLWGTGGGYAGQGSTPCISNAPITIYVDNIMGTLASGETCADGILNNGETEIDCGGPNCPACPNPPSDAPTIPPNRAPGDVISVYSDSYTDEATEQRQPFGDAVVTELDYSGNMIISATTPLPGAGFQYQYFGSNLDLSGMSHMHIDFYFEGAPMTAGTFFTVIAQYNGGSNAVQNNIDVTSLASNTWHEIDVTFDSFAPGQPRDQIQQIIVQINGPDIYGPFYVDNIYFHNNVLSTNDFETSEFKVFPNPTKNDWNISSSNTINNITVYDILGKQVLTLAPNSNEVEIDASALKTGIYFAKIEGFNGSKTVKLIKE